MADIQAELRRYLWSLKVDLANLGTDLCNRRPRRRVIWDYAKAYLVPERFWGGDKTPQGLEADTASPTAVRPRVPHQVPPATPAKPDPDSLR